MLVEIEPRVVARVRELIADVGEAEFRRGVGQMTQWDTQVRSLDDVICLYVMARRGRVHAPEMGRRVHEVLQSAPGRSVDDAGFSDRYGRRLTPQEWTDRRTVRLTGQPLE